MNQNKIVVEFPEDFIRIIKKLASTCILARKFIDPRSLYPMEKPPHVLDVIEQLDDAILQFDNFSKVVSK